MFATITVARWPNLKIRISYALLPVIIVGAWAFALPLQMLFGGFMPTFLLILLVAFGCCLSSVLHELGHCTIARKCHLRICEFRIGVLGAATAIEGEPEFAWQAAALAGIGPLINAVLAVILLAGEFTLTLMSVRNGALYAVLWSGIWFNCIMTIANLLPVLPLDGGFVLRSLCWAHTDSKIRASHLALRAGWGFIALAGLSTIAMLSLRQQTAAMITGMVLLFTIYVELLYAKYRPAV